MHPHLIAPALIASTLAAPAPANLDPGSLLHAAPIADPLALTTAVAGTGVVAKSVRANRQKVLRYWTPHRMARALPIDLRQLTGPKRRSQAAPGATSTGVRWTGGGKIAKTTGRVFVTVDGRDFACTAGAIRSDNRDLLVTAGHCVKDGSGSWGDNWTYVPGYDRGRRPYGTFTARRMFVAKQWADSGDDSYDVGMVALGTAKGRHLADVTGTQRIAFGRPRGGHAFSFGYPAEPPYNGEELTYCGGTLRDDPHGLTNDQGMRCRMTAGASGGPWLAGFDRGSGTGTVISVTSFKYSDRNDVTYGPYLGGAAEELYRRAQAS